MVLWGCLYSCKSNQENPSENCSNAGERVKIILNNDVISRAAIKQINCHAHRAKISNYPLSLSSLCWSWNCQKASRWIPLVQSCWQVCSIDAPRPPPPKRRGLKQPWCLVYRSRYVNRFYTIKLFLKNKWMKSICDIFFFSSKWFHCAYGGFLFSSKFSVLPFALFNNSFFALSYIASVLQS